MDQALRELDVSAPSKSSLQRFFLLSTLEGFVCLLLLLAIPREAGPGFLLGFSPIRFALLLTLLLLSAIFGALSISLRRETSRGKAFWLYVRAVFQNKARLQRIRQASSLGMALGSFLLLQLSLTGDLFLFGILLRLAPLLLLLSLFCAQMLFLLLAQVPSEARSNYATRQMLRLSLSWLFLFIPWFLFSEPFLPAFTVFSLIVLLGTAAFVQVSFILTYGFMESITARGLIAFASLGVSLALLWLGENYKSVPLSNAVLALLGAASLTQLALVASYWPHRKGASFVVRLRGRSLLLSPETVTLLLTGLVSALVALSILAESLVRRTVLEADSLFVSALRLDAEHNVPAYFSAFLLLAAAVLLLVLFERRRKAGGAFVLHWGFLALGFFYLSLDEALSIHEKWIGPLRESFDARGIFSYAWVIPVIPLLLVLALAFARFFFHLPAKIRPLIMIAALVFVGGALGGELLSGWYASYYSETDFTYIALTVLEESMELGGLVIFIHALLQLLLRSSPQADPEFNTPVVP